MAEITASALWVDVWTKQYEYPERNAGIGGFTLRVGFRGKVGKNSNCLFQHTVENIKICEIWRNLKSADKSIETWGRNLKDEDHVFRYILTPRYGLIPEEEAGQ